MQGLVVRDWRRIAECGMVPLDQTRFGWGIGNCWEACLSILTGIPLDEFAGPFLEISERNDHVASVLDQRGLFELAMGDPEDDLFPNLVLDVPHMVGGSTASGVGHMVIAIGDEIVWDPNPKSRGLVDVQEVRFLVSKAPKRSDGLPLSRMSDVELVGYERRSDGEWCYNEEGRARIRRCLAEMKDRK